MRSPRPRRLRLNSSKHDTQHFSQISDMQTEPRLGHDYLGMGVGLRSAHFAHILQHSPCVDWFEIISENFMDSGGRPRYVLDQIAERYPIVMHGVSLSIGSTDPLNFDYLHRLKRLALAVRPRWISDHVCWTGVLGRNTHDLLPLPLNDETLAHVVERIRTVQDFLERPLVLENPSSYVTFSDSTMTEWEFIARMAEEANCGLLLDINNVYVSSVNHEFSAEEYIRSVPHDRIVQFHLAGHTNLGSHCIDTHDGHVVDAVWQLYRRANRLAAGVSTLLEWDAKIPSFDEVHAEVLKARQFLTDAADESSEHDSRSAVAALVDLPGLPHPAHLVLPEVQ